MQMGDLIKNRYNLESIRALALDIQSVYGAFRVEDFLASVLNEDWDTLEMKGRIGRIATCLGQYLPPDYPAALGIIDRVAANYGTWLDGFAAFFPVFVEIYGQKESDWDSSMAALARYTPYASSELAVRAFIIGSQARMMAQMLAWSKDENELVRRLASEGCRPQLPWGQALESFKKDPAPILPILEQLKADPSETVRKSVANNLNDISKTHPELVLRIAKAWHGDNEETNWVVKHGCRTLLKKGNREALALFGYQDALAEVLDFAVLTPSVSIGEDCAFSFTLAAKGAEKLRLEYAIDYQKARGKTSRKVFKISEIQLKENEQKHYIKKHSFADVSVRKHYPGRHAVTLIINGTPQGHLDFEVKA